MKRIKWLINLRENELISESYFLNRLKESISEEDKTNAT